MSDFIPSTLINFDEVWQSTSNLEFVKSGGGDTTPDTTIAVTAVVSITASGSISADYEVTAISINAVYELNAIASGTANYDSNNQQFISYYASDDIQNSKLIGVNKSGGFEQNELLSSNTQVEWQQPKLVGTDNKIIFEVSERLQTGSTPIFEQSKLIGTDSSQLFEGQVFIAHKQTISNEDAVLIGKSEWFGFEAMARRQTERQLKIESAKLLSKSRHYESQLASVLAKDYGLRKEFAKLMYSAHSERFFIDHDLPPEKLTLLKFVCRWIKPDTTLRFGADCQQDQKTDFNAGVIFVTNSVSLNRTDDGREIKLLSFDVGIDSNSYAWSLNASVPLSELPKVDTATEQRIGVDLTVNGHLWRFILDACDDTIAFGERSLTIKGKSRAMLLANPYAAQRGYKFSTARSARQIAEAELNRNGVPSGFALEWNLVDVNGWNVPANTYSYTGKTPINSLQWIADAVGGFINADMSADIIHMLERYPIPSWEWAAQKPLKTLPPSLILGRSQSRINKPAYNGVQVWGERAGSVGALIKRTGTSGGYTPPMVTSDLITTNAAARSRGIAILSDTGDMGNIGITMPLHEDFGILKPSTLIGVNDGEYWIGMVRGTKISGKLSGNQTLEIEQSIDIERHFDKELV